MNNRQYTQHMKDCRRISKRKFFREMYFDYAEVIALAYVSVSERGEEYNTETFYLSMYRVMSKLNNERMAKYPYYHERKIEQQHLFRKRNREKLGDWYIKHLLSRYFTMEYLNENPRLIEEKRQELLAIRSNGVKPIKLPYIPNGLIDLSTVNKDYYGYCISTDGDLYSCKLRFGFAKKWHQVSKRKNGQYVRLNIAGVKKDIHIKHLTNPIK